MIYIPIHTQIVAYAMKDNVHIPSTREPTEDELSGLRRLRAAPTPRRRRRASREGEGRAASVHLQETPSK